MRIAARCTTRKVTIGAAQKRRLAGETRRFFNSAGEAQMQAEIGDLKISRDSLGRAPIRGSRLHSKKREAGGRLIVFAAARNRRRRWSYVLIVVVVVHGGETKANGRKSGSRRLAEQRLMQPSEAVAAVHCERARVSCARV